MKTAIVSGAGGFIGRALSEMLLKKGYKVYGVDINQKGLDAISQVAEFVPICVDLEKVNLSEYICESVDVFFHLSWGGSLSGKDLYDEELQINNIKTTVKVCKDSTKFCKHFIFGSSSYEFMKNLESSSPEVSIYGIAKGAASKMCASISRRSNMDYNKAILTNTYGVGDYSSKAVNTIIFKMLNQEELSLVEGNNLNDWVYIDDTVNGLLAIYEEGITFKDYYVGHNQISTFKDKIISMRDLLCPNMDLKFGTLKDSTYVDYSEMNLNALKEDTAFECRVSFEDSIKLTAQWVQSIF